MSSSINHIRFVINPKSGIKQKLSVVELLKANLDPSFSYGITFTECPGHATELAEEAVAQKMKAVIAVGGDGSVNEVGKALVDTDVALGVIPMGSGNGFARHLKIPLNLKSAILLINRFQTKTIDTAIANGEPYLATAGVGFDAHVGWKFSEFGRRGFLSYMQVSTNEFFNYKAAEYSLIIDGQPMNTKAFLICLANTGQYGNNAWIAPSASLFDGKINVCILEEFPPHLTPDIILKLFNKQLEKSPYYKMIEAKEIIIKQAEIYHIDGEPKKATNDLVVKVVPQSLKVIC